MNTKNQVALKYLSHIQEIQETSESNLSMHVIEPILIEELGYKKEFISKEERSENSRKHFDIEYNDALGNRIIVECKKANKKLTNEDIEQITGYINSQGIEWGILTNGYKWLLVNNSIKEAGRVNDKVIFTYDMTKSSKSSDFHEFFSFECIFKNCNINYSKLIHQFKIYKKFPDSSWVQYRSNLNLLCRFMKKKILALCL